MFSRRIDVDLEREFNKRAKDLKPEIRNATHALEVALREFLQNHPVPIPEGTKRPVRYKTSEK